MVTIWGVNFSVVKLALGTLSPLAFNALRFPLAALVVLLVLRSRGALPRPDRRDLPRVLGLGLLGNVAYQLLFIFGLAATRAGTASVLLASTPILTAVLSAGLGHENLDRQVWLGLVSTVAGIGLVVYGGADAGVGEHTLRGDLLMIGAALAWAVYTVGSRDLVRRYGAVAPTAWTLWSGTVVLVAIGTPAVLSTGLRTLSSGTWLAIVYAGALSIGLAYVIWYYGIQRIGSTRTAVYANLVTVMALAVAWVWLGEIPRWTQLVGAAVIIGGVTLARRVRGRATTG